MFIGFAAACAIFSQGSFEPDEIPHFLYAQKAWLDPKALLPIWGRIGCTAYFAIGAPLGLMACRLLAVLVTMLVALGTLRVLKFFLPARVARKSFLARHHVAMIWLLLFAQPCFALNSFTVMSEMLLAACWIWAIANLMSNHFGRGVGAASLCIGLGGLMRPEGWIAIALWPAFVHVWMKLARGRNYSTIGDVLLATIAASLPSLGWYLLGVWQYHNVRWPIAYWPWSPASPYGKTGLLFLGAAMVCMAGWLWIPIVTAIHQLVSRARRQNSRSVAAMLLLAGPLVGLFLMHGFLGTLGLFGSLSLPRYFISIAPMAAILALLGLIQFEHSRPLLTRRLAVTLALIPLLLLTIAGYLPNQKSLVQRRFDLATEEIREQFPQGNYADRIIAAHPYMLYALHMPLDEKGDSRMMTSDQIAAAPVGTLLVMDDYHWTTERRPDPSTMGYVLDIFFEGRSAALKPLSPLPQFAYETANVHVWIKTSPAP